ncbi:MAG: PEP-CTERM sorting domain-containing protein [Planctomycetota bacterium]
MPENRPVSPVGGQITMNRFATRLGAAVALTALCTATAAHAALIGSTLDTFSNDGTGVVPAAYSGDGTIERDATQTATITSTLSLVNPDSDGTNLDAENDGYLLIQRNEASNAGFIRDLGLIEAGDVGAIISIDFDILKPGTSNVNSFYAMQVVNPDDTIENVVPEVAVGFSDTGLFSALTGSPLSYTIQAGDIGKTLQFTARAFVSGNNGRQVGIDAVSIEVIPEPGSAALAAAGLGLFLIRKRRQA